MASKMKYTRKNDDSPNLTEMTAEWTVQAQLKISKPDASDVNLRSENKTNFAKKNPLEFIYRWNSEKNKDECQNKYFSKVTKIAMCENFVKM